MVNDKQRKIREDSLPDLAKDYIEIQTSFNAVFTSMKGSKGIFDSKRKICERYSNTLSALMRAADAYDDRMYKLMKIKASQDHFGVADVLDIIDWVYKKYKDGTESFYSNLAWKDWAGIVGGSKAGGSSSKDEKTQKD